MNRRGVLGALALVLALVGGMMLYLYVSGADQRALASLNPSPVLVVVEDVPAGLSSTEIASYLEMREIPSHVIVPGALTSLDEIPEGQVLLSGLSAGEQLLAARFVSPDDNLVAAPVPIPEGLQLVSIQMSPERVVGSQLNPGDKVGIFVSMTVEVDARGITPVDGTAGEAPEVEVFDRELTTLMANDVLVARVQGAPSPAPDVGESLEGENLPGSEVIVTLAVDAQLAAELIFSKEYGLVWLSRQTPTTDLTEIDVVGAWTVFE